MPDPSKTRSSDFAAAEAALKRAALRARERAQAAGGQLVVWRNGQLARLAPGAMPK